MYHRYFKVTSGPLIEELKRIREQRNISFEQWKELGSEVGCSEFILYSNGSFGGFIFEVTPDENIWKKNKKGKGYTPRKNVPAGKDLWAKINPLPRMEPFHNALNAIGVEPDAPMLFGDGYAYCNNLFGDFNDGTFFVKVPWRDVDPEKLAKYKANKGLPDDERRLWYESELDHLLWTPHDSMTEVKEWEVLKWKDDQKGNKT